MFRCARTVLQVYELTNLLSCPPTVHAVVLAMRICEAKLGHKVIILLELLLLYLSLELVDSSCNLRHVWHST